MLTYAEIHAIIARREREKLLSVNEANELHDQFDVDWNYELTPVELAVGVLGFVRATCKSPSLTRYRCGRAGFRTLAERRSKVRRTAR
jgi:hypothetical protein